MTYKIKRMKRGTNVWEVLEEVDENFKVSFFKRRNISKVIINHFIVEKDTRYFLIIEDGNVKHVIAKKRDDK